MLRPPGPSRMFSLLPGKRIHNQDRAVLVVVVIVVWLMVGFMVVRFGVALVVNLGQVASVAVMVSFVFNMLEPNILLYK